ncbi:MAG: WXG100 family type VII secretion target [Clostridia bacterium]|nr:WXG100 family type VII secretion target [Clostridia bacterium]
MAGNQARLNESEVQAAISNFDTRKHEFQDVVNGIKSVMFDLEDTWTGAAEQAYEGQVRDLLKNLQTILNSMDGAKSKLQLAIQSYSELENENVSAINALDEGQADYTV